MLTWHYITSAVYNAASESDKTADKLFFLSDTKEIYRGTQSFTEAVVLYDGSEPAVKAVGKLYINTNNLEGKVWNGSSWTTVIHPVAATVAADGTTAVSGKAVADYVSAEIAKVTGSGDLVADLAYDKAANKFTVTMADGSTDEITMENVAADLEYDATTGLLQDKNAQGVAIGSGINLDLERFVSEASYDHETGIITLKFNDDQEPLTIDIGDLVDTYTAANSNTIKMTVTGNQFTAEAIVASTAGNLLQATESGLYVAPVDLSGKMDKDTDAVAGNLAKFDANGNAIDAGLTAGGATLAAAPSASVLATEAAVAAIRTTLEASIALKMDKVDAGHADEILLADAQGNAALSGVKVGGATLADAPDAATVATEAAVVAKVEGYAVAKTSVVAQGNMAASVAAASNEKVTSEKAVVDALTWKTTI